MRIYLKSMLFSISFVLSNTGEKIATLSVRLSCTCTFIFVKPIMKIKDKETDFKANLQSLTLSIKKKTNKTNLSYFLSNDSPMTLFS